MEDDGDSLPPVMSRLDKGKAKVDEHNCDEYEPELNAHDPPEYGSGEPSGSGDKQAEMCFSKVLTRQEVDPTNPMLYLDAYEAYVMTGCEKFLDPPSDAYSKVIQAFDTGCVAYSMLISYCVRGDWIGFSITQDWGRFVRSHDLKPRDKIIFYRRVNPDALHDFYYYDLTYVRADTRRLKIVSSARPEEEEENWQHDLDMMPWPEPDPGSGQERLEGLGCLDVSDNETVGGFGSEQEDVLGSPDIKSTPGRGLEPSQDSGDEQQGGLTPGENRRMHGPDFLDMPDEAICLSKTLTELEVLHEGGKPRLLLNTHEARLLLRCPNISRKFSSGTLSLNLAVFDEENEQYDMLLSYLESPDDDGQLLFSLDAGWQRFVKMYNLKAGDEVYFYRLLARRINGGRHYYAVRYKRMGLPSGSGDVGPASVMGVDELGEATAGGSVQVGSAGGGGGGEVRAAADSGVGGEEGAVPSGDASEGAGPTDGGDGNEGMEY